MTTNDTSDYKLDYKWLRVNRSKNVRQLSSLTLLLKVITNKSGYERNYNSAKKLFKVAKQDIIIEKLLRWFFKQHSGKIVSPKNFFLVGIIIQIYMQPLGDVLQNSRSKNLLKKPTEPYLWETSSRYFLQQQYRRTDLFENSTILKNIFVSNCYCTIFKSLSFWTILFHRPTIKLLVELHWY